MQQNTAATAGLSLYDGNTNSSSDIQNNHTIDNDNVHYPNMSILPQPDMIPFNVTERIHTVTASTTLLRPRKPGDLLPIDYEPTNLDVCSGRGKRNWTHSGNVSFRDLIQHSTPTYMAAASKNEKTAIVCNIVEEMRALGCQFLKQDSKTNQWYDMGDAQARDKVGHSLRDQVTAYNRSQITGAPLDVEPLSLENMMDYNNRRMSITAEGVSKTHIRRPSLALSDSGNEAEERRMSLDTTSIHGQFARRPSWVASSESTTRTDDAVMEGNDINVQAVSAEDCDVLGEIPVMPVPNKNLLFAQKRRISSWDFLDTFDYYIDNDVDSSASRDANFFPMRSMSTSSEITPTSLVPIVSEDATYPKNSLTGSGLSPGVNANNIIDQSQVRRYEKVVQQSITMADLGAWNPLLSKGQIDKMLQDSLQSWDPRLSSNRSNLNSISTVRRSAMAGGTTIRRFSNSLKLSDRTIESILNGVDFGDSYGSLDLEPPTVSPGNGNDRY